MTKNYLI